MPTGQPPRIKWAWLRSGPEAEAHLCIILPDMRTIALCDHPFLTTIGRAPNDAKQCDECLKIWRGGKQITLEIDGRPVVVRPAVRKYTGGTLDPFMDVADQLQAHGVAFFLAVGIPGQEHLRYWSNIVNYGPAGLALFKQQMAAWIEQLEKKLNELHDNGS